jgi:dUTP pyrophosphatase
LFFIAVDPDYRGSIQIVLTNNSNAPFIIEKNMRIAQLIPLPYFTGEAHEVVETMLSSTERNEKGFGSTGTGVITRSAGDGIITTTV